MSIIVAAIWLEKRRGVFLNKSFFFSVLLFHFMFILINVTLYLEYVYPELQNPLIDVEKVVLIVYVGVGVLNIIVDMVPGEWMRSSKRKNINRSTSYVVEKPIKMILCSKRSTDLPSLIVQLCRP